MVRIFFGTIAEHTNLYAVYHNPPANFDAQNPLKTSDASWKPTTEEEIKAYFAILILMGIKDLPEHNDYWSTDAALGDQFISSRMSRRRYEKLSKYVHLTDPNVEDANDKLGKVRPFIKLLKQKFRALLTPGVALTVDEAMIKFNGRLSWKQYMPKKPTKWGIKVWCLCDAASGYCLDFQIYTGKDAGNPDDARGLPGLAYRVVMARTLR